MTRPGRKEHPTWDYLRNAVGDDAWLVGGAARFLLHREDKEPKDWDVLTDKHPTYEKCPISDLVEEPSGTYLGGVRAYHPIHGQLEFFEEPLATFLRVVQRAKDGIAIHFKTGAVVMTDEFAEWVRTGVDFNITARPVRDREVAANGGEVGSGKWRPFK